MDLASLFTKLALLILILVIIIILKAIDWVICKINNGIFKDQKTTRILIAVSTVIFVFYSLFLWINWIGSQLIYTDVNPPPNYHHPTLNLLFNDILHGFAFYITLVGAILGGTTIFTTIKKKMVRKNES